MKIKPPHKKASVEDLIQWMKNRQWTTTLRSEEKNIRRRILSITETLVCTNWSR